MMNETKVRIKGVRVPHETYQTRSGLMYAIQVGVSVPQNINEALAEIGQRYRQKFHEDMCASASHGWDGRDTYVIAAPQHRMGLKLCGGNTAKLFVPDSVLDERDVYVLNELMRIFGVQKYEATNVAEASARELKLVPVASQKYIAPNSRGLSATAISDIEEAVSNAGWGINLSPEVIRFMEEVVKDFN